MVADLTEIDLLVVTKTNSQYETVLFQDKRLVFNQPFFIFQSLTIYLHIVCYPETRMSIACIIEQDAHTASQIEKALSELGGRLHVLRFPDLEAFYKWFSALIKDDNPKDKKEDLKLLIGDIQFLGPNYFSLIEKVRKLMVRRGLLQKEEDLSVLLTTFDSPLLDVKQIESRIITNVLIKPFDLPILKQHLQIALANQKAVTDSVVFSQKLNTTAEMLKEVHLESFNELGFTTKSNRPLKIYDVSKYYGSAFAANGRTDVLARCISCLQNPKNAEEFNAEFRYIDLTNQQVKKLRQSLFSIEHDHLEHTSIEKKVIHKAIKKNLDPEHGFNFLVFIKSPNDPGIELKDAIEQNLANTHVLFNRNMVPFTEALAKDDFSVLGQKPIHCLVLNADTFNPSHSIATWTKIQDQITTANMGFRIVNPKPKIILASNHEISEVKIRELSNFVDEIVYTPIDRPYLNKRIVTLFPEIQPRQSDLEIMSTKTDEIIRVANPIEITSISEACLTMKYYRPISFHSFRRFCLPPNHSGPEIELLASCYFNEKKDNVYINHFVFFGITDKYLKYIRKWILERYIASKESAA